MSPRGTHFFKMSKSAITDSMWVLPGSDGIVRAPPGYGKVTTPISACPTAMVTDTSVRVSTTTTTLPASTIREKQCRLVPPPTLKVVEFFAGLGGMRLSLPAECPIESITGFEISNACNDVNRHNSKR